MKAVDDVIPGIGITINNSPLHASIFSYMSIKDCDAIFDGSKNLNFIWQTEIKDPKADLSEIESEQNLVESDSEHTRSKWYLMAIECAEDDKNLLAQAYIGLGNARYTDSTHENNGVWYQEALNLLGDKGSIGLKKKAETGLENYRKSLYRKHAKYLGRLTKDSEPSILTDDKTYGTSIFDTVKSDKPRQNKKHNKLKIGYGEKKVKIHP